MTFSEAAEAGHKPVSKLTVADLEKVYSGKPGCGCGCNGNYHEVGEKTFASVAARLLLTVQLAAVSDHEEKCMGVQDLGDGALCYFVEGARYYWLYTKPSEEDLSYVEMAAR
jgi:hypothetical protein